MSDSLPYTENMRFKRAMIEIFLHEGGYVDHPKDPGGATNKGITQATLSNWRGYTVTKDDVRELTDDEAMAIYYSEYWRPVRSDDLSEGLALCVFDCAVNSGPSRAARILQGVAGVKPDGVIGPATISAANAGNQEKLIRRYSNARISFLMSLKHWKTFGRGWEKRVRSIEHVALSIAELSV